MYCVYDHSETKRQALRAECCNSFFHCCTWNSQFYVSVLYRSIIVFTILKLNKCYVHVRFLMMVWFIYARNAFLVFVYFCLDAKLNFKGSLFLIIISSLSFSAECWSLLTGSCLTDQNIVSQLNFREQDNISMKPII